MVVISPLSSVRCIHAPNVLPIRIPYSHKTDAYFHVLRGRPVSLCLLDVPLYLTFHEVDPVQPQWLLWVLLPSRS